MPDIPERAILSSIKRYLKILKNYQKLTYTRIHVMPVMRSVGKRNYNSVNLDMAGFSDLEILANGKIAYMEVKTNRGNITDNQKKFLIDRANHGAKCCVVRSLDDAIHFIQEVLKIDGNGGFKTNRPCRYGDVRRISYGQGDLFIYQNPKKRQRLSNKSSIDESKNL